MEITFNELSKESPDRKKIEKLYYSAFPSNEIIPLWFLKWKANRGKAKFYSILDEKKWVGFIYIIKHNNILFVLYFAIDSNIQSKGYGGSVLSKLKEQFPGDRIILFVESPDGSAANQEQRIKRIRFYKKHEFKESGYKMKEGQTVYELLEFGHPVSPIEFRTLIKKYTGSILSLFFKYNLYK